MSKTKSDYLKELSDKAQKVSKSKSPKVRVRRHLITGIAVVGTIAIVLASNAYTTQENESVYDQYIEGFGNDQTVVAPYEHMNYRDLFEIWQKKEVGNDINALMSHGRICAKDGIQIKPCSGELEGTTILQNGKEIAHINQHCSSLNLVDGSLYFCDDISKDIYKIPDFSQPATLVAEGNFGETIISDDHIYSIDLDNTNKLICMNDDGSDLHILIDSPVDKFLVCGNTILYLDTSHTLSTYDLETSHVKTLANNIERFCFDGNIYAESQNKIIKFSPTGKHAELVYSSTADQFRMVTVLNEQLYFQEAGQLLTVTNDNTIKLLENIDYVEALISADDEHLIALTMNLIDSGIETTMHTISVEGGVLSNESEA